MGGQVVTAEQLNEILERMPWGDTERDIRDVELILRLALEATEDAFMRWENVLGPAFESEGYSEVNLPADRIEEMSQKDRFAYVARLLRTLAISYGVDPGFGYLAPWRIPARTTRPLGTRTQRLSGVTPPRPQ